jgi:hypothetical protein
VEKISGHTWHEKKQSSFNYFTWLPLQTYLQSRKRPPLYDWEFETATFHTDGRETEEDYNVCPDFCPICICLLDMLILTVISHFVQETFAYQRYEQGNAP